MNSQSTATENIIAAFYKEIERLESEVRAKPGNPGIAADLKDQRECLDLYCEYHGVKQCVDCERYTDIICRKDGEDRCDECEIERATDSLDRARKADWYDNYR